KNETCTAQSDQDNYSSCSEKSHRTTQQNQTGNIHSDNNSNSKVQHKLSAKTPNRNPGPKLQKHVDVDENFERKAKMMQRNVVRPLSVLSRKKEKTVLASVLASACKPGVIVEKTPEIVKPKETAKLRKNYASCSQGKRTLTVPKEPKFHGLHVPKSCITRKPT
ncbi:DNA ligase 1-like, partial [Trifolium medium]|nr:DNA ligase 1-like [Trifolium medium]